MLFIFITIVLIYPWVKIWHSANTKNAFINLIDTLREGERVHRKVFYIFDNLYRYFGTTCQLAKIDKVEVIEIVQNKNRNIATIIYY